MFEIGDKVKLKSTENKKVLYHNCMNDRLYYTIQDIRKTTLGNLLDYKEGGACLEHRMELYVEPETVREPVLYILVRTDMASMTAGRVAAQACHAANQCKWDMDTKSFLEDTYDSDFVPEDLWDLFEEWETSAHSIDSRCDGFGTTIILDGISEQTLLDLDEEFTDICKSESTLFGETYDPTYPIRDGEVTHLVNVLTCMYVFTFKGSNAHQKLQEFSLYG